MNIEEAKATMLVALEKSMGLVTYACKRAGISRATHYRWMASDPDYKAAVKDLEEEALDLAESKLFEKITGAKVLVDKNNPEGEVYQVPPSDRAIIFYLKTKGKKRGYTEREEAVVKPKKVGLDLYEEEIVTVYED